jgi:alkaline phosphatase
VTFFAAAILLTMAVHPASLFAARARNTSKPVAKNIIVMIADGWH